MKFRSWTPDVARKITLSVRAPTARKRVHTGQASTRLKFTRVNASGKQHKARMRTSSTSSFPEMTFCWLASVRSGKENFTDTHSKSAFLTTGTPGLLFIRCTNWVTKVNVRYEIQPSLKGKMTHLQL